MKMCVFCVVCCVLCIFTGCYIRVGLGPEDVSLIREVQRVLCPLSSFNQNLLSDSADQGDDFTVFNQPLPQFDDSNRRRCFSIGILEDVVYEDSENFQVSLSQESGSEVTINPMIATITILDLDRE